MTEARSCTATFEIETHTLSVTKSGSGSGGVSSSPAGISCGVDCSEDYDYQTAVTLTASPAVGSDFVSWAGDCSGTPSPALWSLSIRLVRVTPPLLSKRTLST